MNKLILLTVALIIFSTANVFSQCTPVPFPGPSLTNPDTTAGLSIAAETQAYSQVIQIRIPADTNFNGAVIPIDSAGIVSVTGAPASISWVTNSANNYWPGDTFGCVIIQGTPTIGEAGNYDVVIEISVSALGTAMPYTLHYNFQVLDASFAGIDLNKSQSFQVFQNQPNPFTNVSVIDYFIPKSGIIELNIYDILGKKVLSKTVESYTGKNSFLVEKEGMKEGVYIYEIIYNNTAIRKRMILE